MAHALQSSSSDTFSSAHGQMEKLHAIDVSVGAAGDRDGAKGTVDGAHVAIFRQTTPHVIGASTSTNLGRVRLADGGVSSHLTYLSKCFLTGRLSPTTPPAVLSGSDKMFFSIASKPQPAE